MNEAHDNNLIAAPAKLLVDEREAARLLSMSPRSLFTLRATGKIPHVKIGRAGIRYSVEHLRAFIQSHTDGSL